MSELKPCPFCGGEPHILEVKDEEGSCWSVLCPKCGIGEVVDWLDRDDAIEKWNRRAET